jgi:hypothetical protein
MRTLCPFSMPFFSIYIVHATHATHATCLTWKTSPKSLQIMLTHSKIHIFHTHDATSFIILGGKLALGGSGRVKKGCPPILSHSQAQKVHTILTERAIKWNAVHVNNNGVGGDFVDVCLEVIRAHMPNDLCVLNPPSLPTVKNWQRQARGINRSGSKKNDGRIREP